MTHRSRASIAAVAAWWLDGEQLVEVEIDNRLQLFCGSGFGEVFRQTIEPGTVFVLQRYYAARAAAQRRGRGRARGIGARVGGSPSRRSLTRYRVCRSAAVIGKGPRRGLGIVGFLLAIVTVTFARPAIPGSAQQSCPCRRFGGAAMGP